MEKEGHTGGRRVLSPLRQPRFNNCIAKMEVGCLEYPGDSTIGSQPLEWNNAPMTGTTAQPSHEPPHKRTGTGSRHTAQNHRRKKENSYNNNKKKLRERKGEENGRKNLIGWKKPARKKKERANESHDRCSELLGMRKPKERWTLALKALLVLTPLNCI